MHLNCLSPCYQPKPTCLFNHHTKNLYVGPTHFPCKSTSHALPKFSWNLNVNFDDVLAVTHNKVLIAAGVSAAIGQLSKPLSGVILYGRPFDIKAVVQAGGFPSTHSSAVVATATCLALERGFSDSIFGLAAVYAGLVMYDAQGVRREVGIHAKTLNRLLHEYPRESITDIGEDRVTFVPRKSPSMNLERPSSPQEPSVSRNEQTTSTQLLKSKSQKSMNGDDLKSFGIVTEVSERLRFPLLKESIGHTEIEVIAGALLGFIVSLTVNIII